MTLSTQPPQKKTRKNKSRRKKRRTEDFSSDSDSDSSADDRTETQQADQVDPTADIDDIVMSENEDETKTAVVPSLSDNVKEKLQEIQITANSTKTSNKSALASALGSIQTQREELMNKYLGVMAKSYDQDMDVLRQKPDFTAKSLPLLAKLLREGGNIFDEDTLKAIV